MTRNRSRALAGTLALFALPTLPAAAAAQPAAPEAAPFSEREAARRYAPRTALDWRALEALDVQAYVDRLAALDGFAMTASELVIDRDPRERTTSVARDILKAHEAGRAIAEEMLPQSDVDGLLTEADARRLEALRATTRPVRLEEAYVEAMIEAHREAVALTSFYRRFGADEDAREFARRILPMLEASLYRAVAIRQELVADRVAAREEGG